MAEKRYLVAAASSDGIVVNRHFGKAECFYIYEVDEEEGIRFIEKREVVPVCDGGNHDESRLKENVSKFADCSYLLVSRIGNGATAAVESMGIDPMELPGVIEESIHQLITYRKIQRLFA